MRMILISFAFIAATSLQCKKDSVDPRQQSEEERLKMIAVLDNHIYGVDTVAISAQGPSAMAFFADCIKNDSLKISSGTDIEIRFGGSLCGKESNTFKRSAWALLYDSDGAIIGLEWPIYKKGEDYYKVISFNRSLFKLDYITKQLTLSFEVGVQKYNLVLMQIQ